MQPWCRLSGFTPPTGLHNFDAAKEEREEEMDPQRRRNNEQEDGAEESRQRWMEDETELKRKKVKAR